jgi:integrase
MKTYPKKVRSGAVVVRIYKTRAPRLKSGFIYQVGWNIGSGRKLRQFAAPDDALVFAQLKADTLAAGRAEATSMTSADVDLLTACREIAGDISPLQALKQWKTACDICSGNIIEAATAWRNANKGTAERITLADAVARFKAAKASAGVNVKLGYKNRFEVLQSAFPNAQLANISTQQLNRLLEQIPHPVTRNTIRKNLLTFWRWAMRQGYLPEAMHTAACKTEKAEQSDRTAIGICSPATAAELLKLIATEHHEYIAPLALAIFTGMRRGEVHNQSWSDIDLEAGTLHVTDAKPRTPADRLVEIPASGLRWLALCKNREGNLCSNLAIDRIRDIGRTAGLDLPPNCFRHSCSSYQMAIGKSAGEVATIAGTSEQQIHKHYRRPRPASEGAAWFAITPETTLTTKARKGGAA